MNFSNETIQREFNKLDVGYYLGEYIPVTLDTEGVNSTSYFDPMNWEIVIAVNNVHQAMANVSSADQGILEETLRSVLFHEVSHALRTPKTMFRDAKTIADAEKIPNGTDIINIFEDERIETLEKHTFIKVNFKKNIMRITGWDPKNPKEPESAMEYFFQVVRYRWGQKDLVNEVSRIIDVYQHVDARYVHAYTVHKYITEVFELYKKCCKDFDRQQNQKGGGQKQNQKGDNQKDNPKDSSQKQNQTDQESQNSEDQGSQSNDNGSNDSKNSPNQSESASQQTSTQSSSEEEGDGEGETEEQKAREEREQAIKDIVKQLKRDAKKIDSGYVKNNNIGKNIVNYYDYRDPQYTNQMIMIFNEFESRLQGETGARLGYSGKIMPRMLATRQDYRVFVHESVEGDIMKYAKLHLTLVIDSSGSMEDNKTDVRALLMSLCECERRCKKFSFDYISMGEHATYYDKRNIEYTPNDGSNVDEKVDPMIRSTFKQNAVNKVLILMDGDMLLHAYRNNHSAKYRSNYAKLFELFNYDNYIIICDTENEPYIKYCPRAKVKLCKDYVTEFRKEIIKQLAMQCRL